MIAQGHRDGRMFILDSTDGGTAMFTKGQKAESDIDLWHKRIGHVVAWRVTNVPNVDMCGSHVRGQAPGLYPLVAMEEMMDFCACGSIE